MYRCRNADRDRLLPPKVGGGGYRVGNEPKDQVLHRECKHLDHRVSGGKAQSSKCGLSIRLLLGARLTSHIFGDLVS